jgi:hypothetical protein
MAEFFVSGKDFSLRLVLANLSSSNLKGNGGIFVAWTAFLLWLSVSKPN